MTVSLDLRALATRCRWVPGTTDRVSVQCGQRRAEWTIVQVKLLLGSQAVYDLYLRGRFEGPASSAVLRALSPA